MDVVAALTAVVAGHGGDLVIVGEPDGWKAVRTVTVDHEPVTVPVGSAATLPGVVAALAAAPVPATPAPSTVEITTTPDLTDTASDGCATDRHLDPAGGPGPAALVVPTRACTCADGCTACAGTGHVPAEIAFCVVGPDGDTATRWVDPAAGWRLLRRPCPHPGHDDTDGLLVLASLPLVELAADAGWVDGIPVTGTIAGWDELAAGAVLTCDTDPDPALVDRIVRSALARLAADTAAGVGDDAGVAVDAYGRAVAYTTRLIARTDPVAALEAAARTGVAISGHRDGDDTAWTLWRRTGDGWEPVGGGWDLTAVAHLAAAGPATR